MALSMGFCSDITKLRRAEEALGESESMFRRTFELSPVGIALVSLDFQLLRANRAYCRILGRSEGELRDLTLEDITHPDDVEKNLRLQKQLGMGEIADFQMEKRLIRKDGSIVHGLLVASLIRNLEGEPQFFSRTASGHFRDQGGRSLCPAQRSPAQGAQCHPQHLLGILGRHCELRAEKRGGPDREPRGSPGLSGRRGGWRRGAAVFNQGRG